MNCAEIIKSSVTMQNALEHYGFRIKRGFINCPFHSGDHTASLKVYPDNRGWFCFGCGSHGDVISFVERYFGLNYQETCKKLDEDFHLNLFKKPTLTEYRRRRAKIQEEDKEQERKRLEIEQTDLEYWRLFDEWKRLEENKRNFAPVYTMEVLDDRFVEAVQRLPYVEYLLDLAETKRMVVKKC